jgi:hypothetical protein
MNDMELAKASIKKGVEFKVKSGELTEEQAKEILEPVAHYKIIGCTDYKAMYMCSICSYKLDDENCKKTNDEKIYVKVKEA